ncbi:hypothetical protein PAMA_011671 [Pampus argenteus]
MSTKKTSSDVTRALENGEKHDDKDRTCRRLRLTRQDQDQSGTSEQHSSKESSIALVLPQKPEKQDETLGFITPTQVEVEVVKIYLENRPEPEQSVRMLTDEVSQIQEVRYCLKTLREQMAARQSSNNNKPVNGYRVHKTSTRPDVTNGNTVLIESDAHVESNEYRNRLAEQSERLQEVEKQSEERGQTVEELQCLLGSMGIESSILKDKMAAGEAALLQLKADREKGQEKEQRCAELEKEVAILKEKIHHFDDMLKSQQRKVRHMIEQLQNSRTVIQERDRVIKDLEEKVSFLEAENREMHDHMEYYLANQDPPALTPTENKPEVVYSKSITPTRLTNKSLPLIKVIEIKS